MRKPDPVDRLQRGGVHETFAKTHCPFMCGVDCTAAESTTDAGSVSEIPDGAAVTNQDDADEKGGFGFGAADAATATTKL